MVDAPCFAPSPARLAQVLRASQGLNGVEIDRLFPGFAWDKALDGLMRA